MIEALKISKTKSTPEVNLDKKNNIFTIKGELLPENSYDFFLPIINWFNEYSEEPLDYTEFQVAFNIINSSSTRNIISVIKILDTIAQSGKEVTVVICHLAEDEIMEYMGYELTLAFPALKIITKIK